MAERSAGLLVWRRRSTGIEVLLAHPGGPFWARRDHGAWTIPKGGIGEGEESLVAARREFAEETGLLLDGTFTALSPIRQKSGKQVEAWAIYADLDLADFVSNTFEMEWPKRSGRLVAFPEIDRVGYFPLDLARVKILPAQVPFIDELAAREV